MTTRKTRRLINGVWYTCLDIGCADLKRAADNRGMVGNKQNIIGYIQIEEAVAHTPLNQPLPSWIPIGVIPLAENGEKHSYSGGRIDEDMADYVAGGDRTKRGKY